MVGVGFGRCMLLLLLVVTCILSQPSPSMGRALKRRINGAVIDCVDIHKQPSLDHPLLKNHAVQLKPSSFPNESEEKGSFKESPQLIEICPEGTVPVPRTKKTNYPKNVMKPADANDPADDPAIHEHAVAAVTGQKYYGAKATISIWNPRVEDRSELSISQVTLVSEKQTNVLAAGSMVDFDLYGDNDTHFFTAWTTMEGNSTTSGCYNLNCDGFVQTSNVAFPGAKIVHISIFGGQNYELNFEIFQARNTGNWWLYMNNMTIGYWPKELLPSLKDGASEIQWGGEIINWRRTGHHTSTQMGSGHFPIEGLNRAAFISNIMIVDSSHIYKEPTSLQFAAENSNCYDVKMGDPGTNFGTYIYFGGPGRSDICP